MSLFFFVLSKVIRTYCACSWERSRKPLDFLHQARGREKVSFCHAWEHICHDGICMKTG